jgi:choline dehydrogenase-like flavoprotein
MATGDKYDCIVVGAGAAGNTAAAMLAEAGKRVLLVERGNRMNYQTDGRRDHLRNQRLAEYGHNAGPDVSGNPRVFVDFHGVPHLVRPHEPGYGNNAAAVGGGTVVYGAQAWRFLPDDFRMASRYGVPAGSSLADWPIGYADLAPWYDKAEWEIGVAGDDAQGIADGLRSRNYPLPPVPQGPMAAAMRKGAEVLGIAAISTPMLINTAPYNGRAACIQCGSCIGFTCPADAKNGSQNTMLPRALATGACELLSRTMVEQIDTDDLGKVIGVTLIEELSEGPRRRSVRSKAVMLCAGATESARLLLLSRSKLHPMGLGNAHDQVGRHLQGHYYPTAFGAFEHDIYDPRGPGVTTASTAFNHGNDGIVGGGMLSDDFVLLPIIFWKQFRPPEVPHWGSGAKEFMRSNYKRVTAIRGPVQEIPSPDARVQLDPVVRDRFGIPVLRLSGTTHPETVRTAKFMIEKARAWITASGAVRTWSTDPVARLSGGQHQAGTCRMGSDPKESVTDRWGRVWGHENLFVSDGSLHPTNGGFNPVLTIMALALRNGQHLGRSLA